jgi:hypothetical protein
LLRGQLPSNFTLKTCAFILEAEWHPTAQLRSEKLEVIMANDKESFLKSHPITEPLKSNNKYPITQIVINNTIPVSQNI